MLGCVRRNSVLPCLGILFGLFDTGVGVSGWSPDPGRGKPDSPVQLPLISLNFTRSPPRTGNKVILRVLQLSDLKNRGLGYRRRPVFLLQRRKALRQMRGVPLSPVPLTQNPHGSPPCPACTRLPAAIPSLPWPDSSLGSRVNRTHYPKVAKIPEKPPEPAGLNFSTRRRLPHCLLLPPRKVD